MKKLMNKLTQTMLYFFTPEDSTAIAGQGNISFDLNATTLNLGSIKAIFWVLGTMGLFYLLTLV